MNELIIGSHVGFNKKTQLLGSLKEALSYNSNAFMFYTGAPQNTARSQIEDGLTLEALSLMKENNINYENIIVHAPYIINLCNENKDTKEMISGYSLKKQPLCAVIFIWLPR